jgi:hypothetical protein
MKTVWCLVLFLACLAPAYADRRVMSISSGNETKAWFVTDSQIQVLAHWDVFSMAPPVPLVSVLQNAQANVKSVYGEANPRLYRIKLRRLDSAKWAYVLIYVRDSTDEKAARKPESQLVAVVLQNGIVIDPVIERK